MAGADPEVIERRGAKGGFVFGEGGLSPYFGNY